MHPSRRGHKRLCVRTCDRSGRRPVRRASPASARPWPNLLLRYSAACLRRRYRAGCMCHSVIRWNDLSAISDFLVPHRRRIFLKERDVPGSARAAGPRTRSVGAFAQATPRKQTLSIVRSDPSIARQCGWFLLPQRRHHEHKPEQRWITPGPGFGRKPLGVDSRNLDHDRQRQFARERALCVQVPQLPLEPNPMRGTNPKPFSNGRLGVPV